MAPTYLNGVKVPPADLPRRPVAQSSRAGAVSRAGRQAGLRGGPEQTIALAKGDERRWSSSWWPCPPPPPRLCMGATPGAQVFIDQTLVGTVQARRIVPGADHQSGRALDRAAEGQDKILAGAQEFRRRQTVRLTEADLALREARERCGSASASPCSGDRRPRGRQACCRPPREARWNWTKALHRLPPARPAFHGAQRTRAGKPRDKLFP